MSFGKPVIATGWSGNMDFMDQSSGVLIGFKLIPVSPRISAYDPALVGENQKWADPDVDAAAAAMRELQQDPALRLRLGQLALFKAKETNARYERGTAFSELCALAEDAAGQLR